MPTYTKPASGTPANTALSISSGLVLCMPFNEGSGAPGDVSASSGTTAETGDFLWGSGDATYGAFGNFASTALASGIGSTAPLGGLVTVNNNSAIHVETYTVAMAFKVTAANISAGGDAYLITKNNSSGISACDAFFVASPTNGIIEIQAYDGTHDPIAASPLQYNDGAWHMMWITRTQGAAFSLYIDNHVTPVATVTDNTTAGATLTTVPFQIGSTAQGTSTSRWIQGAIGYVNMWNRVLSGTEMTAIAANPFAMFAASLPVIANSNINAAGNLLTTNFTTSNAPMLPASGVTGMTVKLNGASQTISGGACASSAYTGVPARVVFATDTVLQEYTPGNITDSASNALAAVTDGAVTNNSTVSAVETDVYASRGATGALVINGTPNANSDLVNIYQGTTSGGESGTPVASGVSLPHTITGLTNGTVYYFKVKTVGAGSQLSAFSNEASQSPSAGGGGGSNKYQAGRHF